MATQEKITCMNSLSMQDIYSLSTEEILYYIHKSGKSQCICCKKNNCTQFYTARYTY